jgi:hypothetical protein
MDYVSIPTSGSLNNTSIWRIYPKTEAKGPFQNGNQLISVEEGK